MRNTDCSKNGDDQRELSCGQPSSAIGKRAQILILLTALGGAACGKTIAHESLDASPPDGTPSAMPLSAYSRFEKGTARAKFAADFTKEMPLSKGADGFFLPPDYQWKLEEALKKAGAGGEVPDDVLRKTDNAVLAQMLQKLFNDWAHYPFPEKEQRLYRGPYVQHLYRHYRNLRYLEVLPDQPAKKGDGDLKKLIEVWSERDQKAWQLTSDSPFFGNKKDPATAGPLEKPLMPFAQKLMTELTERFPNHDSFDFRAFYLSKIQSAVLDMVLPGLHLEAIRDRNRRAGLSGDESGFSESNFETELKKAFAGRARFFGKDGAQNASDVTERRIFETISEKFREFGKMEHPLELYRHN